MRVSRFLVLVSPQPSVSTVWDFSSDVHLLANFDLLSPDHGYIHRARIKIQQWVEYRSIVTAASSADICSNLNRQTQQSRRSWFIS